MSKHIFKDEKMEGTMCGQITTGTTSLLSLLRPIRISNAASCTLASHACGNMSFKIFQPLTSSNLRLNEVEMLRAVEMRRSTRVAVSDVGRSPSSNRHIRVNGSEAVNLLNIVGLSRVDDSILKTSSALDWAFM